MDKPIGGRAEGAPLRLLLGADGLRARTGQQIDYNGPARPGRNGRNGRANIALTTKSGGMRQLSCAGSPPSVL